MDIILGRSSIAFNLSSAVLISKNGEFQGFEQSGKKEIHNLGKRVHMESTNAYCNEQQIKFCEVKRYDSANENIEF